MSKIKFIKEEINQTKVDKLTVEELHTIQFACTEFAKKSMDYLLSEVGSALPENDKVEMVKKINLCKNFIIPKIEDMIKIEEQNDSID